MEQASRSQRSLAEGELARRAGQHDAARTAFAVAIAEFHAEGDLLGEARALTRQAQIARDAGNLDWALHDQTHAIVLFRRAGDGLALAHALRHAGEMFLEQRQFPFAVAQLCEAMDIYLASPAAPTLDLANAMRSVARLAEALGERTQARYYWQEARNRYALLDPSSGMLLAVREAEDALDTLSD